jgi:hypothetical protein
VVSRVSLFYRFDSLLLVDNPRSTWWSNQACDSFKVIETTPAAQSKRPRGTRTGKRYALSSFRSSLTRTGQVQDGRVSGFLPCVDRQLTAYRACLLPFVRYFVVIQSLTHWSFSTQLLVPILRTSLSIDVLLRPPTWGSSPRSFATMRRRMIPRRFTTGGYTFSAPAYVNEDGSPYYTAS